MSESGSNGRIGTGPDGHYHRRLFCANFPQRTGERDIVCLQVGRSTCSRCHLVKYCGKQCQTKHWPTHRFDCNNALAVDHWVPRWAIEKRLPSFIDGQNQMIQFGPKKYLWGNVPAFDVLNLKDNEGVTYDKNLHLCFAASGDIRNLVQTIVELPRTYTGTCTCVLNDRDSDVVLRNAILLLTSVIFPTDYAAEMMLHIWYSARLPSRSLELFLETIVPLISEVCKKIERKDSQTILSKTWHFGSTRLQLLLKKSEWESLLAILLRKYEINDKSPEDSRKSIVLSPLRVDHLDRHLFKFQGHYRVGILRYRETGILAPFGACLNQFDKPNSTLFNDSKEWLLSDAADPLDGWSLEKVLQTGREEGIPRNDPYGALFFHIRNKLTAFCQKLKASSIYIRLFHTDAISLPDLIRDGGLFDRIEVTNLPDRGWLGVAPTLYHFGSLIQKDNPQATLIGLFLNAVAETRPDLNGEEVRIAMTIAKQFLQPRRDLMAIQGMTVMDMGRDLDGAFNEYVKDVEMVELSAALELVMKEKHTIIEKWPFRIKETAYSVAAKRDFELLYRSGLVGWERYVEWKKK